MPQRVPQPWRLARTVGRHDYRLMGVREDILIDPRDGTEHPRFIIEATDWVNIIPVTKHGMLVMVRQYRFGIEANSLEIPGGIVDPGQTPLEAATRELEEETGYRAGSVVSLGSIHPNPAWQTNRAHSFLALDCVKIHEGHQESGEDIVVELVDRTRIPDLIRDGTISHGSTVAAFHLLTLR